LALAVFAVYKIFFNTHEEVKLMGDLSVNSKAFENGGFIPTKYTGMGEEISPPLQIGNIDPGAKTIAIIVDDPDAPITPEPFIHWVIYNIPADVSEIHEDVPKDETVESLGGATQGVNGIGKIGYLGPKPPTARTRTGLSSTRLIRRWI
jgi:Raf kinase inhibitor-like YbhB/YbcL family protein